MRSVSIFRPVRRGLLVVTLIVLGGSTLCGCTALKLLGLGRSPEVMSTTLEADDVDALVADFMTQLQASAFWQQTVQTAVKKPKVALWPIHDATGQRLDEQLPTLLRSIEIALFETRGVSIADRSHQEDLAKEFGVQDGAAFDSAVAQKLGRRHDVEYFITGKLTSAVVTTTPPRQERYSLLLQMLDVDSRLIRFQVQMVRDKTPNKQTAGASDLR